MTGSLANLARAWDDACEVAHGRDERPWRAWTALADAAREAGEGRAVEKLDRATNEVTALRRHEAVERFCEEVT